MILAYILLIMLILSVILLAHELCIGAELTKLEKESSRTPEPEIDFGGLSKWELDRIVRKYMAQERKRPWQLS